MSNNSTSKHTVVLLQTSTVPTSWSSDHGRQKDENAIGHAAICEQFDDPTRDSLRRALAFHLFSPTNSLSLSHLACPSFPTHSLAPTTRDMRSIALVSIVSSLALFASANPEPCSDHPGVIHPPGTFAPAKIGTAAKLSLPHPHKSASSPQRATEKKKNKKKVVQHAPAKKETTKSSHAWTPPNRSTEHKKKKAVPKIAHSSTKTVIDGANKAVDQFKNATLIPSPLASALASAVNEQLKPTNVVTSGSGSNRKKREREWTDSWSRACLY